MEIKTPVDVYGWVQKDKKGYNAKLQLQIEIIDSFGSPKKT